MTKQEAADLLLVYEGRLVRELRKRHKKFRKDGNHKYLLSIESITIDIYNELTRGETNADIRRL